MLCTLHNSWLVQHKCDKSADALCIAWGSYMRAQETLRIRVNYIAKPGDPALSSVTNEQYIGIHIPTSKTGSNQFTLVRNDFVCRILRGRLQNRRKGKLFRVSYSTYLAQVKKAFSFFRICKKLTPHSARIGGALHDYLLGVDVATIAIHGGWASVKSLQYYLKNGRVFLKDIKFSQADRRNLAKYQAIAHAHE